MCVDEDCPYPEHVGECGPKTPEQWEHLARMRAKRIAWVWDKCETARTERDEALKSVSGLVQRTIEDAKTIRDMQAARVKMEQEAAADAAASLDVIIRANDALWTDAGRDPEHTITCHADTLPECFQRLSLAHETGVEILQSAINDLFEEDRARCRPGAALLAELSGLRAVVNLLPKCDEPACGQRATRFTGSISGVPGTKFCDSHGDSRCGEDLPHAEALRKLPTKASQ